MTSASIDLGSHGKYFYGYRGLMHKCLRDITVTYGTDSGLLVHGVEKGSINIVIKGGMGKSPFGIENMIVFSV